MAMLLPLSVGFLLLLVADGAIDRMFCKGQHGTFDFKTTKYTSLDVKDSRGATIVHWAIPGSCTRGKSSLKLLEAPKCNATDIVITVEVLTPEDASTITLVRSGETTALQSYNITIAEIVSLNEYCSFHKQKRNLECNDIQHLYNRTVRVQDAESNVLLRLKGSSFSQVFQKADKGSFKVELDADPVCFHPFPFDVESAEPPQPAQNAGLEAPVPAWSLLVMGILMGIPMIVSIILIIYITYMTKNHPMQSVNLWRTCCMVQRQHPESISLRNDVRNDNTDAE